MLIVDDDRLVADTLALIFGKNGFDARAAYSADDALACAREFLPDLLLCDVTMPGRDGLGLVIDITHELPACRIIVLTGFYSNLVNVREQSNKLSAARWHSDQALPAGGASSPSRRDAGQRVV